MVPTHRERLMSTCREAEFGDGMDPIDASPHAAINAAMECEISAGEHKGGGLICKLQAWTVVGFVGPARL